MKGFKKAANEEADKKMIDVRRFEGGEEESDSEIDNDNARVKNGSSTGVNSGGNRGDSEE